MMIVANKIAASMLAVIIFATTVHCACGSPPLTPKRLSVDAPAKKCCDSQAIPRSDSKSQHGPAKHKPACNHCEAAVVAGSATATNFKIPPSEFFSTFEIPLTPSAFSQTLAEPNWNSIDFHEFLDSPTLLRLHCALNT